MIDPLADFDDPRLFEPWFRGPTWNTWRAVLKAAFGSPLDHDELELFKSVAERDPPPGRVSELWCLAGRRSGKDSIASFLAAHIALASDFEHLVRPGERATVLCLAVDRDQAGIVLGYIRAYFEQIPALAAMVVRSTDDGLELSNNAQIIVATNSYRAVRGRTVLCAIFDEVGHWRGLDFVSPDFEVYNAISPGTVTMPDAMLIGISTPYRRSGLAFETWERSYGKPDPDVLVVQGPSVVFNPTLLGERPQRIIRRQMEMDPERAGSEWMGTWRSDLSDLVSRAALEACVVPGRYEMGRLPGVTYLAFSDPSGGSADSFTVCVCHRDEKGRAIVDAIREARPPFSPASVVNEYSELLKQYGVYRVQSDRYAGLWPQERWAEHGIVCEVCDRTTPQNYLAFLAILNSGRCELLDHPRMVGQFLCLERRTSPSGRDLIIHPVNMHDDIATSVAGAVVAATADADPLRVWSLMGQAA